MGPFPYETQGLAAEKDGRSGVFTYGRRHSKDRFWMDPRSTSSPSSTPETKRSSSSNRKRHSFFGRNSTDASNSGRKTPTLHSTMTSQGQQESNPVPLRPASAQSRTRRKKSEPLQSIRNSLFGRRKPQIDADVEDTAQDPPYRASFAGDGISTAPPDRAQFLSQEDYYHHIRKSSISPPFNFQHVTHTAKKHLPQLQTVDEKELTAEFWAVSTKQKPRSTLNGIKADDLADKQRAMGITNASTLSRPTSPVSTNAGPGSRPSSRKAIPSNLDEVVSSDPKQVSTTPKNAVESRSPTTAAPSFPKRHASINALGKTWPVPPRGVPESRPFYSHIEDSIDGLPRSFSQQRQLTSPGTASNEPADIHVRTLSGSSFRAKQPLPPVPSKPAGKTKSKSARNSSTSSPMSPSRETFAISQSKRPLRLLATAPAMLSVPDLRKVATRSNSNWADWEDDVDFCYQQEAESTCNFDWKTASPAREGTPESCVDDRRLSAWTAQPSALASDVSVGLRSRDSNDAMSGMGLNQQHKRGSSVGHRGFLAARNPSMEMLAKRTASPALGMTPELDALHTFRSAVDREAYKPPFAPGTVHFTGFEGNGTEYLSDLDSTPSAPASKHRKSNSYDSSEGSSQSANSATDNTRWSSTSASSSSETHHKGKSAVRKSRLGQPLETLPQSPGLVVADAEPEPALVPQSPVLSTISADRHSLMMRRPQTPGERAAMQYSGRAMQRSRPSTPNRFSRLLSRTTNHERDGSTWL